MHAGNYVRRNMFNSKVKTNIDPRRLAVISVVVIYDVKSIMSHEQRAASEFARV